MVGQLYLKGFINQSFYQEILLLQKFNDIGGKVLKPKKIQPPTSKKKNEEVFFVFLKIGISALKFPRGLISSTNYVYIT